MKTRPLAPAWAFCSALAAAALLLVALRAEDPPPPDAPAPAFPAALAGDPWTTGFAAASAEAARTGRSVLLDFTGSDWCVWCRRLRDEVFAQPWFLDYARQHLVLVEVDFPRRAAQPPALAEQNKALAERFGVEGYPTIVLLDPSGREIGRLAYMHGGAKTFVRELKRLSAAAAAPAAEPAPPAPVPAVP